MLQNMAKKVVFFKLMGLDKFALKREMCIKNGPQLSSRGPLCVVRVSAFDSGGIRLFSRRYYGGRRV